MNEQATKSNLITLRIEGDAVIASHGTATAQVSTQDVKIAHAGCMARL